MRSLTARILLTCLAIPCVMSPAPLAAQNSETPFGDRAPASVVMEQTIAVGEIELSSIDIPATLDALGMTQAEDRRMAMEAAAAGVLQPLRDAGASKIFMTVPGRAIMFGGVCFVIPCENPAAISEQLSPFLKAVPPPYEYVVIKRQSDVVFCPAAVSDLFQEMNANDNGSVRPEIDRAFASVASYPHRFVFDLPDDLQREVAAIWPAQVAVADGVTVTPQQMLRSVESIAWGVKLPPEPQVEMRVRCTDERAAAELNAELQELLALVPRQVPRPRLEVEDAAVVGRLSVDEVQSFLAGATGPLRQQAAHQETSNALKQLGLALHNFHARYGFFPGKYTVDDDGKPLLSWRVALLPYLEQQALYEKFRLNEPWDSPHNRQLLSEMPEIFRVPNVLGESLPAGQTRIRLPVIEGSAWAGEGPPKEFSDITDGTSNTIWVAVAPESAAVPWTKPDEWQLDEENLLDSYFGDANTVVTGWFDGSVHTHSREIDPMVLKKLLTIAGGEVVDNEEIK